MNVGNAIRVVFDSLQKYLYPSELGITPLHFRIFCIWLTYIPLILEDALNGEPLKSDIRTVHIITEETRLDCVHMYEIR